MRYERLFLLPENQYAQGAPVILMAGALLRDKETGKLLGQLKIQNIQEKSIKAVTVAIQTLDTVGEPFGDPVPYQYLDLDVRRDAHFGTQIPIILPEQTRAFHATVTQVIFTDNEIWDGDETPWESLPEPAPLSDVYSDPELLKQYRIFFGGSCSYQYQPVKDLWRCACGAWNRQSETHCHACGKESAALANPDLEALTAAKELRLEEEAKQAQEAKEKQAVMIAKGKKWAKVVIPVLLVVIIAGKLITGHMEKVEIYNNGLALIEAHEYSSATQVFEELGDFKDSPEQIQRIQTLIEEEEQAALATAYENAKKMLDDGESYDAYYAFESLGDYKDSAEWKEIAQIQNMIDTFTLSRSDADEYFTQYRNSFTRLEGDSLAETMVGDWLLRMYYQGYDSYTELTIQEDGIVSWGTSENITLWLAEESILYLSPLPKEGETTLNKEEAQTYEIREVADGLYIAYNTKDDNKAQRIYMEKDSDWAKRFLASIE